MGKTGLGVHDAGGQGQFDELGHLAPHAAQDLQGLLLVQDAGLDVLTVVGDELLVHAAVGDDAARALFQAGEGLGEPVGLHGFMEGAGGMFGHPFAAFGDLQQFLLADRIFFRHGLFTGQGSMAVGKDHHRVADQGHGFQEGALVQLVSGVLGVQGLQAAHGVGLHARKAQLQHFVEVQHPLQAGTQRGRLGNDVAGREALGIGIGIVAAEFRHVLEQGVMVGLALPVGTDLAEEDGDVFLVDADRRVLARGEVSQDTFIEVAVQLGIDDAVAPLVGAQTAHDELGIFDIDGHLLGHVHQGLGPAQGQVLAFRLLHGFGEIAGALDVDIGRSAVKGLQHVDDAGVVLAEPVGLAFGSFADPRFLLTFTAAAIHHDTSPCIEVKFVPLNAQDMPNIKKREFLACYILVCLLLVKKGAHAGGAERP